MMGVSRNEIGRSIRIFCVAALLVPGVAAADVVTDSNARAAEIASKEHATPYAVRAMAITQVSVFEAVNSITGRYSAFRAKLAAAPGASIEAAVASATRSALLQVLPAQQAAIESDYQAALASVAEGTAKTAGIEAGEAAAKAIVAMCANDGSKVLDTYRPETAPGRYIPTTAPLVPHWGKRKPWIMTRGDQLRPGPPPALDSEVWKRDLAEIKSVGRKDGSSRTEDQTTMARFWTATGPLIYWPVARSVAASAGRDVTDNARLLAAASMAMDDALIAVFDAKYHYNFWRPVTAIRSLAAEGTGEEGWTPFIDTPMHPEYPCAHCILSASLGAVLEAEIGTGTAPALSSTSPAAPGVVRSWSSVADFTKEVASARIYDGVHYRFSTEVGTAMGTKIGALAASALPKAPKTRASRSDSR
jgi:hypothetical protein